MAAANKKHYNRDFPGCSVVRTSLSNAGGAGWTPGQGASRQKIQNIKPKQYCNKFNKIKKVHIKKKSLKKKSIATNDTGLINCLIHKKKNCTSGVVQWLKTHLPMEETWVRSLVQEDSACCRETKPVPELEPTCCNC